MRFIVEPMSLDDISEVVEVEKEAFGTSWSAAAYRRELTENRRARYVVLREVTSLAGRSPSQGMTSTSSQRDEHGRTNLQRMAEWVHQLFHWRRTRTTEERGRIVGFAGMWVILDEAHVTSIAVRKEYRGLGLGELLLIKMFALARPMDAKTMTLEVRVSNAVAQSLYRKYGFEVVGSRRRYYTDNNEDALIMSTGDMTDPEYETGFKVLKAANENRTGVYDP